MTAVRLVGPRKAWEPGSSAPAYASTSVSRTATSPWRSTALSSRGATSSTGPPSSSASSGEPGTVSVEERGDLVELLADPRGGGAATTVPRGHRTGHGEDLPHAGRQGG